MVEEMHAAALLANAAREPFAARTIARHILIRVENFIAHSRGLRKPLNTSGFNTQDFHKRKEVYADEFVEYFKVARDRLGAHVQDFDFGKRVELWNDIEIIKIAYFVDGALEIYRSLAPLAIPGYTPYAPPTELSDNQYAAELEDFFRAASASTGLNSERML